MKIFLLLVAALLISITLATEPVPATTTPWELFGQGEAITIDGPECRELFFSHFLQRQEDLNAVDRIDDSANPYNINFEFPMAGVQWANMTDLALEDITVKECKVKRDIHGLKILATGIDSTVTGRVNYFLEPMMPVQEDHFGFTVDVKNSTIYAELHNEHPDMNEDESDSFEAVVFTFIPQMELETCDSDYTEVYDKLAHDFDFVLRTLFSVMTNQQLEVWLEEYCEDHDCNAIVQSADFIETFNEGADDYVRELAANAAHVNIPGEDTAEEDEHIPGHEEDHSSDLIPTAVIPSH